jgi:hypothetical protein
MIMQSDIEWAQDRVARELYPITLAEARREVILQALTITALLASFVIVGSPGQLLWMVAIVAPGLVATVRDLRWWLWLRHADPIEANRRLEARELPGSPTASPRVAIALSVVLFVVWWFIGR